jgi:lysophospholipase L1-like esterase
MLTKPTLDLNEPGVTAPVAAGRPRKARPLLVLLFIMLWVVGGFLVLELVSRRFMGVWHVELINRHMQPYLMTGGYYRTPLAGVPESHVMIGPGAPEMFGYARTGSSYVFDFQGQVRNVAERGRFLFQDRADLADGAQGDTLRVMVVGGSVAYGVGASRKETRWFEVLERDLTAQLQRPVRLIPAANPGYVSTQERLVLDFFVLPRHPDAVIILNGWNDAVLPSAFGSRPGDPYDQGILYRQYYSPSYGLQAWAAKRSHLMRSLMHRSMERAIGKHRERISSDPALLRSYAQSVAAVYADNVGHMLKRCAQEGIPCQLFLQPALDISRHRRGERDGLNPFTVEGYGAILTRVAALNAPAQVHDLTNAFSGPEQERWYFDSVHFEDPGQAALARAMRSAVLSMLRAGRSAAQP